MELVTLNLEDGTVTRGIALTPENGRPRGILVADYRNRKSGDGHRFFLAGLNDDRPPEIKDGKVEEAVWHKLVPKQDLEMGQRVKTVHVLSAMTQQHSSSFLIAVPYDPHGRPLKIGKYDRRILSGYGVFGTEHLPQADPDGLPAVFLLGINVYASDVYVVTGGTRDWILTTHDRAIDVQARDEYEANGGPRNRRGMGLAL